MKFPSAVLGFAWGVVQDVSWKTVCKVRHPGLRLIGSVAWLFFGISMVGTHQFLVDSEGAMKFALHIIWLCFLLSTLNS